MPIIGTIASSRKAGGLNLTPRTLPVSWGQTFFQKGGNSNKWLAIASGNSAAATSSNGITWTTITLNPTSAAKLYTSARYSAAGPQGEYVTMDGSSINYSQAGTTWSAATPNTTGPLRASKYTPVTTHFRLFSGAAESSSTGVTWAIRSLAWGGGYDIAFNNSHTGYGVPNQSLWEYTTGATWASFTTASLPASKQWCGAVWEPVNARFVVYDNSGAGAYSSNGTTWTSITMPTLSGYSFAGSNAGGGGAFVLANSNAYLYSKDGITFSKVDMPETGSFYAQYDSDNNYFLIHKYGSTSYWTGTVPA